MPAAVDGSEKGSVICAFVKTVDDVNVISVISHFYFSTLEV